MRRREFIAGLGGAVAWPIASRAQQGAMKRIGVLMVESEGSADTNARIVVFENAFKQLGRIPGRNLQIDYRWAMGDIQRMRALAADLVNSAPDALVAVSTPALASIQKETHTIPIVFVAVSEPVVNGLCRVQRTRVATPLASAILNPVWEESGWSCSSRSHHAYRASQ